MTSIEDTHTSSLPLPIDSGEHPTDTQLDPNREILLCRSALREQTVQGFVAVTRHLLKHRDASILPQVVIGLALGSPERHIFTAGAALLRWRPNLLHPLFCAQLAFRVLPGACSDDPELQRQQRLLAMLDWGSAFREYEMELRGRSAEQRAQELASLLLDPSHHALTRVSYAFLNDPSAYVRHTAVTWMVRQIRAGCSAAIEWALIAVALCLRDPRSRVFREELLAASAKALVTGIKEHAGAEEARLAAAELAYAEALSAVSPADYLAQAHRALLCSRALEDEALPLLLSGFSLPDALLRRASMRYVQDTLDLLSDRGQEQALAAVVTRLVDPDKVVALEAFKNVEARGRAVDQFCYLGSFITRNDLTPIEVIEALQCIGNARSAIREEDASRCLGITLTLMRHPHPRVSRAALRTALRLAQHLENWAGQLIGMWEQGSARMKMRVLGLIDQWQQLSSKPCAARDRVWQVIEQSDQLPRRRIRQYLQRVAGAAIKST
ncbi:MAG: hypothetical protein QY326_05540 [Bdellovibrionota bacterium]|nr:MAG: hypothetical protein QY326_05540 [Bdellovibrionota bacterium]